MDPFIARSLATIFVLGAVALLLGLAAGGAYGWAAFGIGAAAALAHHLRHLQALRRWLARPAGEAAPEARGVWDEVFARLHRRERDQADAQRRLLRELARSREAARALPDGAVILDADNRIEWCNDHAERHFGINIPADAGQPITHLVRDPEFRRYVEAGDYANAVQLRTARAERRRDLEGGDYAKSVQLRSARADLLLAVQLIPYGDAQKLLLSRDVTQVEKLETMRRDFIANVSHELRTPLTVLVGFLETLRELKLDSERRSHYTGMMADQAQRMERIIEDLLRLSMLESSPEPPRDERVPVAPLLARVKAAAEALSGGRHKVTLEADAGYALLGAEDEIESAFGNLASNAIRYTPQGGEVRLVWRASHEGAAFTVEDSGVGIAPEHIPRLTERFYRVDRGRSRETGGTGLGLAIVKHALLRHGAQLEIDSEPGRGSRFTARFPAARVVPLQAEASAAP